MRIRRSARTFAEAIQDPESLADEIIEAVNEVVGEDFSGSAGLRALYKRDRLTALRKSRVWEDGRPTGDILDGTSCVVVDADWACNPRHVMVNNLRRYAAEVARYGDTGMVGLVIGSWGHGGEDPGELVIPDARVIYVWEAGGDLCQHVRVW